MTDSTIAFIGAGRMAQALAAGIKRPSLNSPDKETLVKQAAVWGGIYFFDPADSAAEAMLEIDANFQRCNSVAQAVSRGDMVVIAVKPQVVGSILPSIKSVLTDDQLVVSVAAGISIETIRNGIGSSNVVRVMPNTPCLIGKGISAVAFGPSVDDRDADRVAKSLLGPLGKVVVVPEEQLDAVTGLSGSGPAYVFEFIQALASAGIKQGLDPDTSLELTIQTVVGAASMVQTLDKSPADLIRQVTSPGGTTLAGLAKFSERRFAETVSAAVDAATKRSIELSKQA